MPRVFVNALTDFVIQGGTVSFTLADNAMKNEGTRLVPLPADPVARVVMREKDFAALVGYLNERVKDYEGRTGRKLGAEGGA